MRSSLFQSKQQMSANSLEKIKTANTILLALSEEADLDALAAAFALSELLRSVGKKPSILLDKKHYDEKLKALFPPGSNKFVQENEPGSLVLTIERINSSVKEIRWKEENSKLNIYITAENSNLNEKDLIIKRTGSSADITILIDLIDPKKLGNYYELNKDSLSDDRVVSLVYEGEILPIISQKALTLIQGLEIELSQQAATYLLAGIFWKTLNLTNNANSSLLITAGKLAKKTVDISEAINIANIKLEQSEIKILQKLNSEMQDRGDGVFTCFVDELSLMPSPRLFNRFFASLPMKKGRAIIALFGSKNTKESLVLVKPIEKSVRRIIEQKFESKSIPEGLVIMIKSEPQVAMTTILDVLSPKPEIPKAPKQEITPKEIDPLAAATDIPEPLDLEKLSSTEPLKDNY